MTQETFERELARRAEDVHGAPFSLDDVRGRARSIQRRRRAAVAGAVAAAVVLIVVVPSLLAGNPAKKADAPDPAPPVPGHTAVLHDGTVTLPDGSAVDLPVDTADVTQLGVLTDGRIVLAMQKPQTIRVYAADGSRHVDYPVAYNAITMSAREDAVAWVADDYSVQVLASGSAAPRTFPGIPMPGEAYGSIDAVLDPQHLLVGDHTTTSGMLTPDGVTDLSLPEPFRVVDVSPDGTMWAVAFIPTVEHEQYGCMGLYDARTNEVVARSCEISNPTFSPDGEHLLTLRGDNNMFSEASVVDLDLKEVGSFRPTGRGDVISRAAWADSTHVLAGRVDWRTSQWSLVRAGLDWSDPTVLAGPQHGENPETVAEYVLSE